jgi:basic amino acid/polyamine antiporter, APA family
MPSQGSPAFETSGTLLRILGVGFGLAVIVGNTIGAGILRAPGEVAGHLPSTALFLTAWIAGGLYALLGAIQMAELATMLPRSGGQYVFSRYALGEYPGFLVGWSDWISTCGTTAAVSIVLAEFAGIPWLAVVAAGVFAALQWRGIREGSAVQNVTSSMKALAFAVLIGAAFAFGAPAPGAPPLPAPAGLALAAAFVLALQSVIYTYDGWTAVIYFSEEVEDPGRAIPRALIGGIVLVIVIYLLVNLAILSVLPLSTIAGEEFPAGLLAAIVFGESGDVVFRGLMIVALLSAVNSNHLMASRVLFAMSRDGLFHRGATAVNDGGTPTVALLLSTAVALLFIVFGRTFSQVITLLAFFFIANYTLSFLSLLVLRAREPARPRPYRAWGYPWTTAVALAGSLAFLVGAVASDPRNSVQALVLLAVSYPVFLLLRSRAPRRE